MNKIPLTKGAIPAHGARVVGKRQFALAVPNPGWKKPTRDGAVQPPLLEHVVQQASPIRGINGIVAGANFGSRPRATMRAAAHRIDVDVES